MQLQKLIKKYEDQQPEIVFEWKDRETEAEGWVVINSLRGGAAGGGTRMRKGLNRHEVVSLAKTMDIKFSVAGPPIGGAKSGINFDPADPRKQGVLDRWFRDVSPLLKTYYGTGGDLNVDDVTEVTPITRKYGVLHTQEGVVNGHFRVDEQSRDKRIQNLRDGVSKKITDPRFSPGENYLVADMITGFGVAEAVRHYYSIWGGITANKRAIIQGWGNVASAAAYYLSLYNVSIIGIIDRNGGLMKADGFSKDEVRDMFVNKKGNQLDHPGMLSFEEVNSKIWDMGAEIFIPAAASRLLDKDQAARLIRGDLELMSCGANVPFADEDIFLGPVANYCDDQLAIIPDYIANCGMARIFAYCMSEDEVDLSDEAIFRDTSKTIWQAMMRLHQFNPKQKGLLKKSLEMALVSLVK